MASNSSSKNATMYQTLSSFAYSLDVLSQYKHLQKKHNNFITEMRRSRKSKRPPIQNLYKHTLRSCLSEHLYHSRQNIFDKNNNNTNQKPNTFYGLAHSPSNTYSKLSFDIGALYGINQQSTFQYTESCRNLYKIHTIMKENKERMINYENNMSAKKNKLNSNLNLAEKNYNRLTKDLIPKLEEYNIFLRKKIKEEREIENQLYDTRNELFMCNHRLMNKIEKIKSDIDKNIKIRNFLIRVKEHTLTLPSFLTSMTANIDLSLTMEVKPIRTTIHRKSMINFNFNTTVFSKKRMSIMAASPKQFSPPRRSKKMSVFNSLVSPSRKSIIDSKFDKYLDLNQVIFKDTDEFIAKMSHLEQNNLKLNQKCNENIFEVQTLKEELNEINHQLYVYDELYKNDIQKSIVNLNESMKRFNSLNLQITYLQMKDQIKEEEKPKKEKKKNINNINAISSAAVNMALLKFKERVNKFHFNTELAYMYYYIADLAKDFFNNYTKCFKYKANELEELISILYKPDDVKPSLLRKSCIEVLMIVEQAIDVLFNKHSEYLKKEKNKKYIDELRNKAKTMRKIVNAREQRLLLQEIKANKIKNVVIKQSQIVVKPMMIRSVSYDFKGVKEKKKKKKVKKELSIGDFLFTNVND